MKKNYETNKLNSYLPHSPNPHPTARRSTLNLKSKSWIFHQGAEYLSYSLSWNQFPIPLWHPNHPRNTLSSKVRKRVTCSQHWGRSSSIRRVLPVCWAKATQPVIIICLREERQNSASHHQNKELDISISYHLHILSPKQRSQLFNILSNYGKI